MNRFPFDPEYIEAPRDAVFTIVESEVGRWRLIYWRPRNLKDLPFRSAADAQREDLHVEVEVVDPAASEQSERPGAQLGLGAVCRGVLEASRRGEGTL